MSLMPERSASKPFLALWSDSVWYMRILTRPPVRFSIWSATHWWLTCRWCVGGRYDENFSTMGSAAGAGGQANMTKAAATMKQNAPVLNRDIFHLRFLPAKLFHTLKPLRPPGPPRCRDAAADPAGHGLYFSRRSRIVMAKSGQM